MTNDEQAIRQWWRTSIIDMKPGQIAFRGNAIEDLIGNVSFPQMIWLMVRGDLPSDAQARLFEAALVAGVDHGPQAPSIAAAPTTVYVSVSGRGPDARYASSAMRLSCVPCEDR